MKKCLICNSKIEKKKWESRKYFAGKKYCCRKCYFVSKLGTKRSIEIRQKMSERMKLHPNLPPVGKGENHPNWKGGKGTERHRLMQQKEYIIWRTSVYERDNYTCIWCGKVGGQLNADHIKPWSYYPELRYSINNGRTLCIDCHKKTDSYLNSRYKLVLNNI